ncbi:MAG TPA: hypothetical protein VNC41_03920, partial [Acidimicrobiia bacterium]|nr:hypothetical protein [Acidimicrobiia bacterium]
NYRVTLAGGTLGGEVFTGKLVADVVDYGPSSGLIQVNPVTTLLAAYRDKHPDIAPAQAQDAVRSYLELPDTMDLTADLQRSESLFSGTDFRAQATAAGGVQEYVAQLVGEIDADSGATQSFAGAPQNDLSSDAMNAAAKALVKLGLKQALTEIGLKPEDQVIKEALTNISTQLTTLQASVDNLQRTVDKVLYNQAMAPAVEMATNVNLAWDNLSAGYQGSSARLKTGLQQVNNLAVNGTMEKLHAQLVGAGNLESAYAQYSKHLHDQAQIWLPGTSTDLQNFFDYYESVQNRLILLLAGYTFSPDGEKEAAQSDKDEFVSATGWLGTYNKNINAQEALRPKAAPAPIDIKTNVMYPLGNKDRPDVQWNVHNSEMDAISGCVVVNGIRISCGVEIAKPLLGFADWRLPEKSELDSLTAVLGPPNKLLGLRKAWGNDAFRRPTKGDVTKIWTGTHDPDQRNARHYVVDLSSGNATLQADNTTATAWPVRTVREKYWL